ncbi:PepSY-associated TM helix domain-containing protein [Pedobacter arcticus]|uniref:PepSY-associated TM helix domain-containing protein n=1 Tax=Pedobacter arcticus TaxID=752140 RepID=UPI0002EA351D|nr:PepSY-associated TM helix domain-containing protein [Pedobacter arcticus]
MAFRKVNNWLHLWLGLGSGIIVFIVCITGCIWVFNEEIDALLAPETVIQQQDKPVLVPSQLAKITTQLYTDKNILYVTYQQGRAVNVGIGSRQGEGATLKVNPYTGDVISNKQRKKGDVNFFDFILSGHRFLWMPYEIGRPIVNYATLIFVVLLITGLVWWYPKKWNKKTTEKSFKIKWGGSFKRVNLDLHNVLGFYSLLFLLAIALTGMVYGIKWYSESMYWATSGGQSLGEFSRLKSDSLQTEKFYASEQAIDKAFLFAMAENPKAEGFYYSFPDTAKASSVISIYVYPTSGQFYNNKSYQFDQHTLKQLKGTSPVYDQDYEQAGFGGKLRKMNYDIHVGSILGFPGKVLAFLASLIGASLPITGFLVWWGRKYGKNRKVKAPSQTDFSATPRSTVPRNFVPKRISKKLVLQEELPILQTNTNKI